MGNILVPSYRRAPRSFKDLPPAQSATSATTLRFDIPTDALMEALDIRVVFDWVPTVVTAAGTVRPHNPVELIREMRLSIGDKGIKKQLTGRAAYFKQCHKTRKAPLLDSITAAEAAAAAAAQASATLRIDLASFGVTPGFIGLLDGSMHQTITLEIQLGDRTNVIDGGTYTDTFTTTVSIHRRGVVAKPDPKANFGYRVEMYDIPSAVNTSPAETQVKLPGDRIYQSIMILGSAGTPQNLSDATLERMRLVMNDVFEQFNMTALAMRAHMYEMGWPQTVDPTGVWVFNFGQIAGNEPVPLNAMLNTKDVNEVNLMLTSATPAGVGLEIHRETWSPN